jgi:hypothetical protein
MPIPEPGNQSREIEMEELKTAEGSAGRRPLGQAAEKSMHGGSIPVWPSGNARASDASVRWVLMMPYEGHAARQQR